MKRFYSAVGASDMAALRSICEVVDDPSYNVDWMRKWKGRSSVVVRPRTTEEVSAVLKYCNQRQLPIVPQGGNTGLVGGSVPVKDEIILSTRRMDSINGLRDGVVKVEAGVILENLDSYLKDQGFAAPLDLGAKGSCTIGGNAATNAGGLRFLRYGSLRGSIVGLEVATADGTVLDAGYSTGLRKDNTGYPIHELFIGSEGTLGVITKIALAVPASSAVVNAALFSCESFNQVRGVLATARRTCAEILSACEFFDSEARRCVLEYEPGTTDPLGDDAAFRVLVETSGSHATHDREKLEGLLTDLDVLDGVIAPDATKAAQLWRLREGISDAMTSRGYVHKYDLSLPLEHMYDLVTQTRDRVPPNTTVAGYGHLGDSNLHLNVVAAGDDENANYELAAVLEPWIFDRVLELNGSISAEHGLGQSKNSLLSRAKSPAMLALMRKLKHTMDPRHILNPYKVLPPSI
ncbi:hypothetical protein CTAYLR_003321 [Chrysophaeum taylorii]|uniref:FAD-binding PCMH-type domain-containing protein n=1 Tax=Chrysophaeum taylorii TaxID=2483200 RepID=A0AAD7XNC1_9STRA|nr:hypothetical protein CTAYLR_003321 [Chrysophaeum taylorii]